MAQIPIINFLTYLDILGFKNMVLNKPLINIIKSFEEVFIKGIQITTHLKTINIDGKIYPDEQAKLCHTLHFSDTVLLFTDVPPTAPQHNIFASVIDLLLASCWAMGASIWEGFPLRGAISFGEFYVNDRTNAYLGKSLIEAYECGNRQNWAGIMLAPSFERWLIINDYLDRLLASKLIVKWHIPLKSGEKQELLALNWPISTQINQQQKQGLIEMTKNAFQLPSQISDPGIQNKMDNTLDFLESVLK